MKIQKIQKEIYIYQKEEYIYQMMRCLQVLLCLYIV
nr:MAG TPA: hypothetical protein [Bacteriophage sp.]